MFSSGSVVVVVMVAFWVAVAGCISFGPCVWEAGGGTKLRGGIQPFSRNGSVFSKWRLDGEGGGGAHQ